MTERWREVVVTSRPTQGRGRLVGLIAAALVAGIFVARGLTWAALIIVTVALAMTLARVLSPAVERWVERVLGAITHAVGVVLSVVLLAVVALIVVVPVWVIGRVLRWDALEPDRSERGRWRERPRRGLFRLETRVYTREYRPTGWTRAHAWAVVLVPILALDLLVVTVVFRPSPPRPGPGGNGPIAAAEYPGAFADEPWRPELTRDEGGATAQFDPLLLWRNPIDYASRYVNIVDRARTSYAPRQDLGRPPLEVWFFGGSTLFGYGQRDEHTIVSQVVRRAEADGIAIDARNFGVVAYTNWQEAEWAAELLTSRPAPDLVVFYDGKNDVGTYVLGGRPAELSTVFADQVAVALGRGGVRFLDVDARPDTIESDSPENAARLYNQGVAFSHRLVESFGVPVRTYFQPFLYTRDLPVDDAVLAFHGITNAPYQRQLYDQVRPLLDPGVVDIADCLDDLDREVYWDDTHHNELGADVISGCLYTDLAPELQRLWAAGR